MVRNDIDITDSELHNLFKRLDIDRDTRLTFSEFKRVFNSSSYGIPLLSPKNFSSSYASTSFLRSTQRSSRISGGFESPMRSQVVKAVNTVSRFYSPLRDRTMSVLNRSVEKLDLNRSAVGSPQITFSPRTQRLIDSSSSMERNLSSSFVDRNLSRSFRSSIHLSYEEENFINFIHDMLEIENEIEKAKVDLTYKTDFNVEDAFRNFELDGRGYITDVDVKYGLNTLDVFATREEIALLIKRYDIQGEGVIR